MIEPLESHCVHMVVCIKCIDYVADFLGRQGYCRILQRGVDVCVQDFPVALSDFVLRIHDDCRGPLISFFNVHLFI